MFLLRLFAISLVIFLLPGTILAIMPPEEIAKKNLEAQLILIGEVTETGKIVIPEKTSTTKQLNGLFVLKVLHIVKGFGTVKSGEQIKIVFRLSPEKSKQGLLSFIAGFVPVKIKEGNLVVVYIDPFNYQGFFKPVFEGSSVITIDRSMLLNIPTDEKSAKNKN